MTRSLQFWPARLAQFQRFLIAHPEKHATIRRETAGASTQKQQTATRKTKLCKDKTRPQSA